MITEVKVPEISENVNSGDVISILVKVGDFIQLDQPVVELETEKAAFEVPSTAEGVVTEILINEGDAVEVGQILLKVDTEGKAGQQPATAPAVEEPVPQVPSESGKEIQETVLRAKVPAAAEESTPSPVQRPAGESVPASPSVRQLARELGVDIHQVAGTGPGGRISAEDVKKFAQGALAGTSASLVSGDDGVAKNRPLPDFSKWGPIETESVSVTRRKIAETLSYTWANVPQVTQFDQADITELEEFRKEYGPVVREAGGKLTVTSILLKVAAMVLKEFPVFNASYDMTGGQIIYKKYYHVSVAVDTDRGLLVPAVRDVDKKSVLQLSVELSDLAKRTRDRKVGPDEMVGGNFTISNLGGIGGTSFSPIIYWPQAAILGISRASWKPVYQEGQLERRLIMPLSVSYDHRMIDGVQGARFLRKVVEYLEKPFVLAIGG